MTKTKETLKEVLKGDSYNILVLQISIIRTIILLFHVEPQFIQVNIIILKSLNHSICILRQTLILTLITWAIV